MRAIQKGFTLVELLVVAIIIGILSSLALSAYSKHKENAIRARIFAAVEGWNQVHSAYLSRNLMPPGSRLSNLESPSEAASEVFLVLKPYIPSVRNYASLSDFDFSRRFLLLGANHTKMFPFYSVIGFAHVYK